jgi:hypothetical protein
MGERIIQKGICKMSKSQVLVNLGAFCPQEFGKAMKYLYFCKAE